MINMIKYNKKGRLFGLIGLFIVMLFFSILTSAQKSNLSNNSENYELNSAIELDDPFTSALISRGEIKIYNDTAFISTNGVNSGTGTKGDPYIISNWKINTPGDIGIEVINTTKYFKILNCSISNQMIGIRFENVINGVIYNNTIKDLIGNSNAATGILIENSTNIDITQNLIDNIRGSSGFDGSDGNDMVIPSVNPTDGSAGENGQNAFGISITDSNYVNLIQNNISDILSGNGGAGGNGGNCLVNDTVTDGGFGGNGGDSGTAKGIDISHSNHTRITTNTIYNVTSGIGGAGGTGGIGSESLGYQDSGVGGDNGNRGKGGDAYGIYIDTGKNYTLDNIKIDKIIGGIGGLGGNGGAGGNWTEVQADPFIWARDGGSSGQGGAGGMAFGCDFEYITNSEISYSNITNIFGGKGGNGGTGGKGGKAPGAQWESPGSGGTSMSAGDGGQAVGIRLNSCINFNSSNNLLKSITGGSGGIGGIGGSPGELIQNDLALDTMGSWGSIGGNGGSGGPAYGILGENYTYGACNFNDIISINGGYGGNAGNGADGGIGSMNGGDGSNGGMSGAAGIAIGMRFYTIMNISIYMNYITSICGGKGGNGGDGGSGGHSWNENAGWAGVGTAGSPGGIGAGIALLSAINITNSNNDISFIYGGSGGNGGNGGNGGDGDITERNLFGMGMGGGGGDGGKGSISGGAYGIYHVNVNFTLNWENLISNIQTLDGGSGGNGGDGGDAFDGTLFNQGGNGGNGGNSGSSGNSSGIYFDSSLNNTNKLNEISQIDIGDNGNFGILGIKGQSDVDGNDGVNGISTSNGIGYGFYLDKTNSTLSYLNDVYVQDNLDTRGMFNKWNSTTIGNFWENYTGLDVVPPFGIGDVSYNLTGTSESKDWLPFVDSSAPNVFINEPTPLQVISTEGNSVLVNVTILDDLFITVVKAMINSTTFNLTFTKGESNYWVASWDNITQYPTGDYNITIWVEDWKNNINNTEWVVIQYVDLTPPQVVINAPTGGSTFEPPGSLTIPLSVDATDTYGIASVIAQINASTPINIKLPVSIIPTYLSVWDNFTDLIYPPGDYNITFIVTDNNGNVNNTESVVIKVVKDLVGPNIVPNSPNNGSVHRGPLNISVFVNDLEGNSPNAGDVIATIYNGTMAPFNLTLTNTLLNQWDVVWSNLTTTYYPGYYYINFTAYDGSYYHNINQPVWFLNITYEYDTTAPTINFIDISDNNTVIKTSRHTFSVNIIDENQPQFGDVLFEVSTNLTRFNDTMTSLGGGNWEYTWNNISSYSNGIYLIRAFAIDSAPGAYSNWSLTWEISINIVADKSDGNGASGAGKPTEQFDLMGFFMSPVGLIVIGVAIVAIIIIAAIKGKGRSHNKEREKILRMLRNN